MIKGEVTQGGVGHIVGSQIEIQNNTLMPTIKHMLALSDHPPQKYLHTDYFYHVFRSQLTTLFTLSWTKEGFNKNIWN